MDFAYARVSSNDQNLSRQLEDFKKLGIPRTNIFADKKSGKDFERMNYRRMIDILQKNDLVIIKSIDRLGRNYTQIMEQWSLITRTIGANIFVIDMPLLDTREKSDNLMGKVISDIVLQLLSFVAENERINIKSRQAEGIKLAKEKGIRFGRPLKCHDNKFIQIAEAYHFGELDIQEVMTIGKISRSTFYYHYNKLRNISAVRH